MTDSDEKQRALDATLENEVKDYGPMVQIPLKEYDKLNRFQIFKPN